ncbi:MAG: hypothetical protein LC777_11230 [Actinobacteria bacterium]|nr:hypothetical protein [Actinomycetota bacterium]
MLLSTSGSLASHSGSAPPPGSHPATMTSPSHVKAAECQRPFVPAWPTPGSLMVNSSCGSSRLPPGVSLAPMSKTLIASALAHAALLTSPRITPTSWQPVRTAVAGPASGSRRTNCAPAGSSSGTAMTSMKSPSAFWAARSVVVPQPALLEMLL